MEKISDKKLMDSFIIKHNTNKILDDYTLSHLQLHHFKKNESVLKAGSQLEYYYMLVKGRIKVSHLFENGKSVILKFYKDFITIGDIELFNNLPIGSDVDTEEDSYFLAIPVDIVKIHCYENPNFLHHIISSLSNKLSETLNNSSYNLTYPLINRFSSFIFKRFTSNPIILNQSFKDIALFLGTTYRHLNRVINEMESQNIILCQDKKIHVLNMAKLESLSKNHFDFIH